jgi:hypothetical protein
MTEQMETNRLLIVLERWSISWQSAVHCAVLAGPAIFSTAQFWLIWRPRQQCGRWRAASRDIGWAPTDTGEPNWAYDRSDWGTWHTAPRVAVVRAQLTANLQCNESLNFLLMRVLQFAAVFTESVCMFSHLAVHSHVMTTEGLQHNIATLFPIQTLYSTGLHINYRSVYSKNV